MLKSEFSEKHFGADLQTVLTCKQGQELDRILGRL